MIVLSQVDDSVIEDISQEIGSKSIDEVRCDPISGLYNITLNQEMITGCAIGKDFFRIDRYFSDEETTCSCIIDKMRFGVVLVS